MRCPNCGFENSGDAKECIKCNQAFIVYEKEIATYPPRAGWKKGARNLRYSLKRRRKPRIRDELLGERKGLSWKVPAAILLSVIPGPGQFLYGRRRRGLIFFGIYLVSLVLYVFYLGHELGTLFLCIFISTVGAAMMDIFRLEGISFGRRQSFFDSLLIAVLVICIYYFIRERIENIVEPIRVMADYMAPTIREGDILLVDRRIYARQKPERGDLVQYQFRPSTYAGGRYSEYTGRIIGLPGETVSYKEGTFLINGETVKKELYPLTSMGDISTMDVKVPPDNYYIFMPYRGEGIYATTIRCIGRENILGRIFMLYRPRDRRRRF